MRQKITLASTFQKFSICRLYPHFSKVLLQRKVSSVKFLCYKVLQGFREIIKFKGFFLISSPVFEISVQNGGVLKMNVIVVTIQIKPWIEEKNFMICKMTSNWYSEINKPIIILEIIKIKFQFKFCLDLLMRELERAFWQYFVEQLLWAYSPVLRIIHVPSCGKPTKMHLWLFGWNIINSTEWIKNNSTIPPPLLYQIWNGLKYVH